MYKCMLKHVSLAKTFSAFFHSVFECFHSESDYTVRNEGHREPLSHHAKNELPSPTETHVKLPQSH